MKSNICIKPKLLFLVLILFATIFCGCHGKTGPIELKVVNYYDLTSVNAAEEITAVWEKFQEQNPDIKLIREDYFNDVYHLKIEEYIESGNIPDVMYMWPSGRSSERLHLENLVKDLRPFLERDGLVAAYNPAALEKQLGGFLGELPNGMTYTSVLYANTQVLEECGLVPATTYEELVAQVPVLAAKGHETLLMANSEQWVMQSCLLSLLLGRFGGPYWADHVKNGTLRLTDEKLLKAFQFLQQLCDDGVISKNTFDVNYSEVVEAFSMGKGAYMLDGDWRLSSFVTNSDTGQALFSLQHQEKVDMLVFPVIPDSVHSKTVSGVCGTGWGISAAIKPNSAKEDAAWRLVKWLESKEVQQWRLEKGLAPFPSRMDVDMNSANLEPIQRKTIDFTRSYTGVTPVFDGEFSENVSQVCNSVLPLICLKKITPLEGAMRIQEEIDKENLN
ncbi:MAG: extracellular solute-binding protein [Spirochaetaceae bacterium]|nr:extracellular solute-binding protein [Spirochaetaceae bacterium]